ncbi:MAG: hypothetical protein WDM77_17135 [Steroidobacteraceae bacterium]
MQLTIAGTGAFAVTMQARSEADARFAAILDSAGMVLLMLLAYGSIRAAGDRGHLRPGRRRSALRQRSRHHHRLRVHLDGGRAGLPDLLVQ